MFQASTAILPISRSFCSTPVNISIASVRLVRLLNCNSAQVICLFSSQSCKLCPWYNQKPGQPALHQSSHAFFFFFEIWQPVIKLINFTIKLWQPQTCDIQVCCWAIGELIRHTPLTISFPFFFFFLTESSCHHSTHSTNLIKKIKTTVKEITINLKRTLSNSQLNKKKQMKMNFQPPLSACLVLFLAALCVTVFCWFYLCLFSLLFLLKDSSLFLNCSNLTKQRFLSRPLVLSFVLFPDILGCNPDR